MCFSFYSLEYFHIFAYCCFTDASSKASLFLIIALITFLSVVSCGFFPFFFFPPSFCCTAYHYKTYWFKTTWFCGVVFVLFLFKLTRTPQLRWLGRQSLSPHGHSRSGFHLVRLVWVSRGQALLHEYLSNLHLMACLLMSLGHSHSNVGPVRRDFSQGYGYQELIHYCYLPHLLSGFVFFPPLNYWEHISAYFFLTVIMILC